MAPPALATNPYYHGQRRTLVPLSQEDDNRGDDEQADNGQVDDEHTDDKHADDENN